MLTEIQWWGGLVIIWAALTLRFMTQETGEDRRFYWTSILLFVSTGLFFALYFYPLQVLLQRYAFLGLLLVALASLLLHLFLFSSGSTGEQEHVSVQGEGEQEHEHEHEDGVLVSLLGYAFAYGPILACLSIGAVRLPEVLQAVRLMG